MAVLEVKDLHKQFGQTEILRGIDLSVNKGDVTSIIGPSGSGKTTFLRCLNFLESADKGTMQFDCMTLDMPAVTKKQILEIHKRTAFVFQNYNLFANKTALQNVTQGLITVRKMKRKDAEEVGMKMLKRVGMDDRASYYPIQLSGGQQQRVAIARALTMDPKIILCDEATSALDSISENSIQDALEQMMVGRTSIVIAHRLSTILKADRILVVKDGVIAEQGTHEELLEKGGTYKELYETQFRQAIDSEAARSNAEAAGESDGLDIATLSTQFGVRKITESDISAVYRLAKSNRRYYRYLGRIPTRESLTEIISEVPEGVSRSCKHFVGFYNEDDVLVAVMDLITGYPESDDAFIGWLMVDGEMQGRGIGSGIFADVRAAMKAAGYDYMALAVVKENEEALKFWKDQGFKVKKESVSTDGYEVYVMDRDI